MNKDIQVLDETIRMILKTRLYPMQDLAKRYSKEGTGAEEENVRGRIDQTVRLLDIVNNLKHELKGLLQQYPAPIKNKPGSPIKQRQNPAFIDLFRTPYNTPKMIEELKSRLRVRGIIDSGGNWRTSNCINEISAFYYTLDDLGVISGVGSLKARITTFYKEFGKVVDEKAGPGIDTTRVNAIKKVYNHPFIEEAESLLNGWIIK